MNNPNAVELLASELTEMLEDEAANRRGYRTMTVSRKHVRAALHLAGLYLQAREQAILQAPQLAESATPLADILGNAIGKQHEKELSTWNRTTAKTPTSQSSTLSASAT